MTDFLSVRFWSFAIMLFLTPKSGLPIRRFWLINDMHGLFTLLHTNFLDLFRQADSSWAHPVIYLHAAVNFHIANKFIWIFTGASIMHTSIWYYSSAELPPQKMNNLWRAAFIRVYLKIYISIQCCARSNEQKRVLCAEHNLCCCHRLLSVQRLSNEMRFTCTRLKFSRERKKTKRTSFAWKLFFALLPFALQEHFEFIWMENCLWQINWYLNEWILKLQLLQISCETIFAIQLVHLINSFIDRMNLILIWILCRGIIEEIHFNWQSKLSIASSSNENSGKVIEFQICIRGKTGSIGMNEVGKPRGFQVCANTLHLLCCHDILYVICMPFRT